MPDPLFVVFSTISSSMAIELYIITVSAIYIAAAAGAEGLLG
jgi:hypothetical protein